nr:transposase [uncultured Rhodoferax sp.]
MASDARTSQAPKRRFYSPELKLQVVGACAQPGVSIAEVARHQRQHRASLVART